MKSVFTPNTRDLDRYLVRATHSQKLERWIGKEAVEDISLRMKDWYGPPIALAGVPGRVYACGGGDFCGPIQGGYFGNLQDFAVQRIRRIFREAHRRNHGKLNAGFASLSDLISEATTGGKKQTLAYNKTGAAAPAVGASQALMRVVTLPTIGAVLAAPPGGTVLTSASAGALTFVDPTGGDTTHLINWVDQQTTAQSSSLMLTDCLFGFSPNYAINTAQNVTGVPTRYTTAALAPGNFIAGDVTTVLGAGASNVTMTYVDDAGNAAEAGTAQALRVSSAVNTSPFTAPQWFYNLNAGDRGLQKVTVFQLSAATTGAVNRTIEHPIAIMPGAGLANQAVILDGINTAFSFERIYDGACLTLWDWMKSATAATGHSGFITICAG